MVIKILTECNPINKCKKLIAFDDMIADMLVIKHLIQ